MSDKKPSPEDLRREAKQRELVAFLRRRAPDEGGVGCFLCAIIVRDYDLHGQLTDYPPDSFGKGTFPRAGKVDHIRLERSSIPTEA